MPEENEMTYLRYSRNKMRVKDFIASKADFQI